MYNKEYILCAAVKRKELRKCDNPYHEGTNDILNIELGYRHHDIFHRFSDELNKSPEAQGFYTSKGRFVNRKEGYKIALDAGQLSKDRISDNINILYSEDLY